MDCARRSIALLVAFAGGWLLGGNGSAVAESRVLRLSADGALRCPSLAAIARALEDRFGRDKILLAGPSPRALSLVLRAPKAGRLELELSDGEGRTARRALSTQPSECAGLAETVPLVVDNWLLDLPWRGAGFLSPEDAPAALTPASGETAAATKTVPSPAFSSGPSPPASGPATASAPRSSSRPTSSPPPASHPATARVPSTAPAIAASVVRPLLAPVPSPLRLRLGALVATGLPGGPLLVGGLITIERGLSGRLGLVLGLGATASAVAAINPGQITLDRAWSTLEGSLRFDPGAAFALDLRAGLLLLAERAQSSGFTMTRSTNRFDPGMAAGLLLQRSLAGPLGGWIALDALAPFERETFDVANVGSALTAPHVWLDVTAGLSLDLP